jgi:hypothetical protein
MTSPRTPTTRTTTTATIDEIDAKPRGIGLSPVQVAASALAAVSSAVLLSFFGVAGTLIGAALASIVSTVGASLYSASMKKTNDRLRRLATVRRQAAARTPAAPTDTTRTRETVAATRALPAALDPRRAPARRSRPRWGRVAVYAAAVFVVAMGVITGIELIGQKPVAALVTNSNTSGGTTIGDLTNASSSHDTTPTTPTTPSAPTTTAPATSTGTVSPTAPTGSRSSDEESSSASTTSSSSSSAARSSAPSTRSSSGSNSSSSSSSAPAESAAPTS